MANGVDLDLHCLLKPSLFPVDAAISKDSVSVQQIPRKTARKLPISNPKQDLYNINAYAKFCEKPLIFTQDIVRKRKYGLADIAFHEN